MYTYAWYHWLTFFYVYCFFGWIFESTYVSLKQRHFVNRGFLRLPMLPLYGTGAVMMLWVSLPVRNSSIVMGSLRSPAQITTLYAFIALCYFAICFSLSCAVRFYQKRIQATA